MLRVVGHTLMMMILILKIHGMCQKNDSVFTFMRKKGIIVTSVLKGNHCVLILVSSLCTKLENLLSSILSNIFCEESKSLLSELGKRSIPDNTTREDFSTTNTLYYPHTS